MAKPSSKQRGKIIAERVFQRQTPDGTIDTIRIGLEEPVEVPVSPDKPAEPPWLVWQCVAYIEDSATFGKAQRIATKQVDSMGALSEAFKAALVFIEGLSIRYGDTVTYLEGTDLSFDLRPFSSNDTKKQG